MDRSIWKFVAALIGLAALALVLSGGCDQSRAATAPLISGVWCLDMPTVAKGDPYGNQTGMSGARANIAAMESDGIFACQADAFTTPVSILTPLMTAADADGRFHVAYHLDLSVLGRIKGEDVDQMEAAAISGVDSYAGFASAHPSAARTTDGRLVVFWYDPARLGADACKYVRSQVALDLGSNAICWLGGDKTAGFDGYWDFTPGRTALATTVMPSYTRAGMKLRLGIANAVKRLTAQLAAAAPGRAVMIDTWNDSTDGSGIVNDPGCEAVVRSYRP